MRASIRQRTGPRDGSGTLTLGRLQLSIAAIAWGASGVIHGGLLATCYLVSRSAVLSEPPRIQFARGDQAVQVTILSTHWPDPKVKAPVDAPPETTTEATTKPDEMSSEVAARQPPPVLQEPMNPEPAVEQTDRLVAPVDPPTPTPKPPATVQPFTDDSVVDQAVDDTTKEISPVVVTPPPNSLPADTAPEWEPSPSTPAVAVADKPDDDTNDPPPVPSEKAITNDGKPSPLSQPVVSPRAPMPNTQAGVERGAEVLDLPHPRYPIVSRRLGEEGTVLVRVEVLPNGKVGRVSVLSDSGYPRLARAAIAAVRNARFRPAMHHGEPTTDSVRIPFRFVLE